LTPVPHEAGAAKMAKLIAEQLSKQGKKAPALSQSLRITISMNQDLKFKKGWFDVPGCVRVDGWRSHFDERAEAAAKEMTSAGLDTSGCSAGARFARFSALELGG
jgi:hypothetical protein